MLPVYIIDPSAPFSQTADRRAGVIRANFILEAMKEMNKKMQKLNEDMKLIVFIGKPKDVMPQLIDTFGVDALYYERDPAFPVKQADALVLDEIDQRCSKSKNGAKSCAIHGYDTHTLFPMEVYLAKCKDNVAPSTYGVFTKTFYKFLPVAEEIQSISENNNIIPSTPESLESKLYDFVNNFECGNDADESGVKLIDLDKISCTEIMEAYLGYDDVEKKLSTRNKGGLSFQGGEDIGLNLMNTMCSRSKWIWTFEKPKTKPNALSVDTTGLSPYVKHGCVSPRTFYHTLSKVYAECPTPTETLSKPPVSLHGQLMWREYNYLMGYSTPNFDLMLGNPVARQIPWDDDPKMFEAWKNAQTGYPYIDAVMTQLKETGWIHHLARHSVACFLTRGDLWQSWEKGAEVFEEELIDADWSINNFNWQWLSCTAHFYQYFRCYSPVAFAQKTDKNGDYIRKWLPQFKNFPKGYIYEPWKAPLSVQQEAGVIVGKNYPEPIVDHKIISKSNMGRMKQAYNEHKAAEAKRTEASKKPAKRARTKK
jgi:cryptochrome